MQETKSFKSRLMSINNQEEMESFIYKYYQELYDYINENLKDAEILVKMFSTVSDSFSYDLYIFLIKNEIEYNGFLLDIYDVDKDLAFKLAGILAERDISLIETLYSTQKNNNKYKEIIQSLSIKQKGLFLIELGFAKNHAINTKMITCDELIEIFKSNEIDISQKSSLFKNLDIYFKKILIMDDSIQKETIIYCMSEYYKSTFGAEIKPEINDFFLESFISSYKNGSKLSFILLTNFISQKMKTGVTIDFTESSANFRNDIEIIHGIRDIKTIRLERKYVQEKAIGVLFHEFGHFLFNIVRNDELPDNFTTAMFNARNAMTYDKRDEVNELLAHTLRMKKKLNELARTKEGAKVIRELFGKFVKEDLKELFINYMKEQGYSESLINLIISRFDSLNIDTLEQLEIEEDRDLIFDVISTHYMGTYRMTEDFINALFAGRSEDYYYRENATYDGFGHPEYYYTHHLQDTQTLQFNEGFANFTSLVLTGNKKILDLLRSLIGDECYEIFESVLFETACFGIPEEDIELKERIRASLYHDTSKGLEADTEAVENLTDEEVEDFLRSIGSHLFSLPSKIIGKEEDSKWTPVTTVTIATDEHVIEFFKNKPISDLLHYEFENLPFQQKKLLIESDVISDEVKRTLVQTDLYKTFINEEKYFDYVIQLSNRLDNYHANPIKPLLLVEALIEIKRTKGQDLTEEDFRKAM